MNYLDVELYCPRREGWVPVTEGTITATCPYCRLLVPVPEASGQMPAGPVPGAGTSVPVVVVRGLEEATTFDPWPQAG